MRKIFILLNIILIGCCPARIASEHLHDSIRVEVRERVVHEIDTIEVAIPYERETTSTRDTTSHLETTYAISDAMISGGVLFHSLETRPQLRKVEIKKPIVHRDSVIFRNTYRDVKVEVERELTWLQRFQINGFWGMLTIVLVMFFVRKVSRGGLL